MRKIILQEILALSALELTVNHHHISNLAKKKKEVTIINSPPFRVTSTVMPCNRTFLHLNMTSRRPLIIIKSSTFRTNEHSYKRGTYLSIIPEYLFNLRHPTHIQTLRKIRPLIRLAFSKEPTMLRRKSYILQMSQMLLQECTIPS